MRGTGNGGAVAWLGELGLTYVLCTMYYVLLFLGFSFPSQLECWRDGHMASGILTEAGWEEIGPWLCWPPFSADVWVLADLST